MRKVCSSAARAASTWPPPCAWRSSSALATRSSPSCAMAAPNISPVCSTQSGSRRRTSRDSLRRRQDARRLPWRKPLSPDRAKLATVTDAVIVGAGPCGMFQVFELGLLGLKAELIDSLPAIGGQCTELYPDKPIYDIPAIPVCSGKELTDALLAQIKPFGATFHLGHEVTTVQKQEDGRFFVETGRGTSFLTKVVIVA